MTAPVGFAVKPTLTGERVVLRPFEEADLPAMARCLADPDVIRLTGSAHSSAELAAMVAEFTAGLDERTTTWYRTRNEQTDRLDLAVVDRATGRCVGEVVLNDVDPGNHSCGFRTLIGPDGRDRGLGSEATRLIVEYALDVLGLHRVELEVYAFNPRAQRVYEKAGFVVEGRRRDALRFDDEWIDAITMAVVAGRPPRSALSDRPDRADPAVQDDLRAALRAHRPLDERERASVERTLAELDRLPAPFDVDADPIHVTGSALIVGPRGIVLLKHRRLGIWVQPGGHIDPGETPAVAAAREAREETGLVVVPYGGAAVPPLAHVDVHDGGRGHTHLDLRYLFDGGDADPDPPPGESPDVHWFAWPDAIETAEPTMAALLRHLAATHGP